MLLFQAKCVLSRGLNVPNSPGLLLDFSCLFYSSHYLSAQSFNFKMFYETDKLALQAHRAQNNFFNVYLFCGSLNVLAKLSLSLARLSPSFSYFQVLQQIAEGLLHLESVSVFV